MTIKKGGKVIAGYYVLGDLNNPFSLLDYKYSEYELDNASWLLSNGQWNNGTTYSAVYNLLLAIYNGTVTKAGVSVKLSTETYADTDFVLNTGDTTFRLPLKVLMAGSKRVAGNGMALGLTNGTVNAGLGTTNAGDFNLRPAQTAYGASVSANDAATAAKGQYGITTDPTKSGIETSANGLYLYFYVGETVQKANLIAAGQALTDIANLKAHYITETYVNGKSGYRVWSDGYCEQWGDFGGTFSSWTAKTIIFLKPFKDTNYTVFPTIGYTTYSQFPAVSAKTTTTFTCTTYDSTGTACWQACGYIS